MDKIDNSITSYNHGLSIIERKSIIITGVKKIENFDDEEFLMETTMGFLVIKGENLELIKLDTLQGNVSIKGIVKSSFINVPCVALFLKFIPDFSYKI